MNILLISHIFPPAIDGGSRVIYKLGEYLSQDHNTLLLSSNCYSTDDFVTPKSRIIDIINKPNIINLPVYKNLRKPLKVLSILLPKNSYLRHFLEILQKGPIFKIIPLIKSTYQIIKFKPDVIIAGPLPTTIILYANILSKLFKTKLIINASFHQTDPDFHKKPLINTLKKADLIWALTNFEKIYYKDKLDINPSKIIVAGNGVDAEFISYQTIFPKNPNILFVGSLSAHKKVEILISSFLEISSKYPNLTLTIAGQKTLYYPQIKKILKKAPITILKKIKFKFNFHQEDLANLIDSSTFLVLPSIQESFGLVLIESWSRGKPIITSDIPPLKELVSSTQGGYCFEANSKNDLIKHMEILINSPKLCQSLGKNGQKYVKNNYTWQKVGEKIWQKI